MKQYAIFTVGLLLAACSQTKERNAEVVAAENYERQKPLLVPPGGVYLRQAEVTVVNFSEGMEYSTGGAFSPLLSPVLVLRATAEVTIRITAQSELMTHESYTVVSGFPVLNMTPPPGEFSSALTVFASRGPQNSHIEILRDAVFVAYDSAIGIAVSETATVTLRQCDASECSMPVSYLYQINRPEENPPLTLPPQRNLTQAEISEFANLARINYNQTSSTGLSSLMDEAKLLVIRDQSLMANASLRQRFLSQSNSTTASEACTIVARYLYVSATRLTITAPQVSAFPSFAQYYINHIVSGDITVDGGGKNFVWVANGAAMVNRYVPAELRKPFEINRGSFYPSDFSLVDKLTELDPTITLLRDGPSGAGGTHTLIAIRKENADYLMIDTYFTQFNGIALKASAGGIWPYAYRFGPQGSRFLHIVYGY